MKAKTYRTVNDRAGRIYRRLRGARGVDEHGLWQHAMFFAMSPDERCRLSLQTARAALSLRRSSMTTRTALSSAQRRPV